MTLTEKIEDLILTNSEPFEISKAFRESIKEYLNSLDAIFEKNQGKDFLVKHTKAIDNFIELIYKYSLRVNFENFAPMTNSIPITLVALGSYGREQLCVYSDIDLMIVYKDIKGFNTKEIIEKILYTIWDSNLKLGHRVHEVEELEEVAKTDITIKTALIESRFICGSKFLWFEVENKLNKIRRFQQKDFVIEKLYELDNRRKKYPISMEPFMKDGDGSLRDANTIYWIVNAIQNIHSLKELTPDIINENDHRDYRIALEFIFRIRSALHLVAKKKQDRLILEYIVDVAKKLGFKDTKTTKAETILVTKTLQSIWTISILTELFIDKVTKTTLFDRENIKKLKQSRVAKGLFIVDDTVITSIQNLTINRTLEAILSLPDKKLKFDSSFINLVRNSERIKNEKTKILMKKIFQRNYLHDIIFTFFKAQILDFLVPPIKKILFLAQFDGYHKYPVDIHSINSLLYLENIEDDFIKSLFDNLSSSEKTLLRLVTFLHDSGKGRVSDHSLVGERLFKTYAKKLHFNDEEIELGSKLIKHHILMTKTAYHEDIYNERVILSFISRLKSKKVLDMLYVLTYADVNAVSDDIYSNFESSLLRNLYNNSIEVLDKDKLILESARRVKREESLKKYSEFNNLSRVLKRKILNIDSNLFFLKYSKEEVVRLSKLAYEVQHFSTKIENSENLIIHIIKTDDLNLGYLLGKLSNLDLASMDVFNLFDGRKYFRIEFHERIEEMEIAFTKEIIENSFDMSKSVKIQKPIIGKDELKLDLDYSKTYAKIQINTLNQRGLVAYVARVFDEYKINITTAKILTIKNRARDMFLIEKYPEFLKSKEELIAKLLKKES